jgi:hypothetical protein
MLIPISNWPTVRIGVGSLLLVVSHIIAVPVLVLWVALKKKKKTELGCEKYLCRVIY